MRYVVFISGFCEVQLAVDKRRYREVQIVISVFSFVIVKTGN